MSQKKLSSRKIRCTVSMAVRKKMTCKEIAAHLPVKVSRQTISRILNKSEITKYIKMNRSPALTIRHKEMRKEAITKWIQNNIRWGTVIFSDEKLFNLDGADGLHYYWHDIRKDKDVKWSRYQGGQSVMVWGGVSENGTTDLVLISSTMNSEKYIKLVDQQLLTYSWTLGGDNFIFQQDNAACHTSKMTKKWFSNNNINVLN